MFGNAPYITVLTGSSGNNVEVKRSWGPGTWSRSNTFTSANARINARWLSTFRLHETSSSIDTCVRLEVVVICWPGPSAFSAPLSAPLSANDDWATRTSPSMTDTREPFTPALTANTVPTTETVQS